MLVGFILWNVCYITGGGSLATQLTNKTIVTKYNSQNTRYSTDEMSNKPMQHKKI